MARSIQHFVFALVAFCSIQLSHAADTGQQPNIIYIMMDDLDVSDVGAYGSPDIQTKTMDTVAAQGMRFDQYYVNSPVCSPTEAAIITGQHPSRFGFKRAVLPDSKRGIPGDVATVAQVLKDAGYRTAHVGKWFMGTQKPEFLPPAKGFDRSVRFVTDENLSYTKYMLSFDESTPVVFEDGKHLTDRLTDSAIEFIEESQAADAAEPFFLNLWYFAPHRPIEPPADFDNSNTEYCLSSDSNEASCNTQRGDYAALVTHADRQIKRVLDTLDKLNVTDNTLVLITSDNGGDSHVHPQDLLKNRKMRGFKAGMFDGGIRVPMIVRWPGVIPEDKNNDSVIASFDALPTFAEIANAKLEANAVDGTSFLDVLKSNGLKQRSAPLIWENKNSNNYFTNSSGILNTYAIRDGDWKLVFTPAGRPGKSDKTMLFNLAQDPGEQDDLLANSEQLVRDFRLGDYLFELNETAAKPGLLQSPVSQPIVNHLQNQYFKWRRDIGAINYAPEISATGVALDDNVLTFDGGVATVPRDTRFDFNDGDFSFLANVSPKDVNTRSVIAEKPGSWRLLVDSSKLKLEMYGNDSSKAKTAVLTAAIEANKSYHVAFTVFGFRDSGSHIKLYIDGKTVAEFGDAAADGQAGIHYVNSADELNQPMIYIGNDSSGDMPFAGTIELPRMSVLSLYPGEVFWDYAEVGV